MGLGSTCKARALRLTRLDSSPATSKSPLVGIHEDWLHPKRMGFNPSALSGGGRNLANPYFRLPKKKNKQHIGMDSLYLVVLLLDRSVGSFF